MRRRSPTSGPCCRDGSRYVCCATAPGSSAAPILEIAGPREESLVEMATLLAARRADPVRIVGASDPADPDRDL